MRRGMMAFGVAAISASVVLAMAGWTQPEPRPEPKPDATRQPSATPAPARPSYPAPPTPPTPSPALPGPASIEKLAFMVGAWSEKFGEGRNEEHWSAPAGGAMMGMFRMMREDGSPVVYELLTISADQDGVTLRLRHFDPKLIPRESREEPIVLNLESIVGTRATFRKVSGSRSLDAIVYEGVGKDGLKGEVQFTKESERAPIRIDMKRLLPG